MSEVSVTKRAAIIPWGIAVSVICAALVLGFEVRGTFADVDQKLGEINLKLAVLDVKLESLRESLSKHEAATAKAARAAAAASAKTAVVIDDSNNPPAAAGIIVSKLKMADGGAIKGVK